MNIWLVRAGDEGQGEDIAYVEGNEKGFALIGWSELDDLSNVGTVEEIRAQIHYHYPDKSERDLTWDKNQIYNFIREIQENDVCILPLRNPRRYIFGYFVGPYEYFPDNKEYGRHGRAVKWVTNPIPRNEIPKDVRNKFNQQRTVYQIANESVVVWIRQKLQEHGVTINKMAQTIESGSETFDVSFRKRVEDAIDEYDELGESEFLGKHGFGVATDYWVRSTQPDRKLGIYASKALANIALGKHIKGGGWHNSHTSSSVLYNAGYVIVNQNGAPVTEIDTSGGVKYPKDCKFLIQGEKRIRAVAINYYIEPARESDQQSVNIKIADLHDKIGLVNQHELVINALRSLDSVVADIELEEVKANEHGTTEAFVFRFATPVGYTVEDIITDGCFIEKEKLEKILNRFESKKNLILQGPPGTGKTWLAKRLGYALIGFQDSSKILSKQFHPNLSYEDFIRGWRPKGDGKLDLVDGALMEMIELAISDPDSKFVMVIEEINRGNPAQILGEMLTILETDKRNAAEALELAYKRYGGERVYVPENLYIVGTMNLADRSLALVDLALRRRFAFVDLAPTFGSVWQNWVHERNNVDLDFLRTIESRLIELNKTIEADTSLGAQFKIGHSYVTPATDAKIDDSREWFQQIVETEIGPLLEEYWFDEPQKASDAKKQLLDGI